MTVRAPGCGRSYTGAVNAPIELLLLTRPGCHLCAEAQAVIEQVLHGLPDPLQRRVQLREQNILDDESLRSQYHDEIPVVFIDGVQHTFWKVDESRLRAALERAGASA